MDILCDSVARHLIADNKQPLSPSSDLLSSSDENTEKQRERVAASCRTKPPIELLQQLQMPSGCWSLMK